MKIILLLTLAAPAVAQEIKPCPAEFPLEAVRIAPPAGWVGVVPVRLPLSGADVVVGEPGNGALVGEQRRTRGGYEMVYEQISTGLPAQTGIWLACRYGDLALAERLPNSTDRCVVTYAKDADGGRDVRVACHTKSK